MTSKFGASMKARGRNAQTNNHPGAAKAKTIIRADVLDAIGAESAQVFDAFAGDGVMWREVSHRAAGYVGCDLNWYCHERLAYVCDNRRLMRCIDLAPFNVFDFDSLGPRFDGGGPGWGWPYSQ
jgi:hypothetical protein